MDIISIESIFYIDSRECQRLFEIMFALGAPPGCSDVAMPGQGTPQGTFHKKAKSSSVGLGWEKIF